MDEADLNGEVFDRGGCGSPDKLMLRLIFESRCYLVMLREITSTSSRRMSVRRKHRLAQIFANVAFIDACTTTAGKQENLTNSSLTEILGRSVWSGIWDVCCNQTYLNVNVIL